MYGKSWRVATYLYRTACPGEKAACTRTVKIGNALCELLRRILLLGRAPTARVAGQRTGWAEREWKVGVVL